MIKAVVHKHVSDPFHICTKITDVTNNISNGSELFKWYWSSFYTVMSPVTKCNCNKSAIAFYVFWERSLVVMLLLLQWWPRSAGWKSSWPSNCVADLERHHSSSYWDKYWLNSLVLNPWPGASEQWLNLQCGVSLWHFSAACCFTWAFDEGRNGWLFIPCDSTDI